MKICHISLLGSVTDGFTYQDNLLPKHHKLMGHDVSIIASQFIYNNSGKIIKDNRSYYINENGIKVYRLKTLFNTNYNFKFKIYNNLIKTLKEQSPDIIFVHGLQFIDLIRISKFAFKNKLILLADNHSDFTNSASNIFSKILLHKLIWRFIILKSDYAILNYFGVTPVRCTFMMQVYGIDSKKIQLLPLGLDDSVLPVQSFKIDYVLKKNDGKKIITTGGKFDNSKSKILDLILSFKKYSNDDFVLIIFGSINDTLNLEFNSLLSNKIIYIGWLNSSEITYLLTKSSYIVFPGRHSVLWEEALALKKPLLIPKINDYSYLNINGNTAFFDSNNLLGIDFALKTYIFNVQNYNIQIQKALKIDVNQFYYSNIAKKSLSL
jgi:hypothetical protein